MSHLRITPTPRRSGSLWSALFLVGVTWMAYACRAKLEPQIVSGGSAATDCQESTSGGTLRPGCEPFEVTDVNKIVVKPGEAVTLTGTNFRPTMTVAANSLTDATGLKVTVTSDTKASLAVPPSTDFGPVDLTLTQDGVTRKLTIFSNGAKTDYPIFTAGADEICQGMQFYGASGALQTGTKNCAPEKSAELPPPCTTDGQIDCIANPAFKATDISHILPEAIRTGYTVAGVSGQFPSATYRLTGADATLDLPSFGLTSAGGTYEWFQSDGTRVTGSIEANQTINPTATNQVLNAGLYRTVTVMGEPNLVSTSIKSGTSIFGVGGSVVPSPGSCAANGSQDCVATGSYRAATACAADSSNCFVPLYTATTQPLKAVSYDAINAGKGAIRTSLTLAGISGTLPDCASDGGTGCVTVSGFKAADMTQAVAGNIKSGVTIANVTGTYPSVTTPLAANTGASDLTTFGAGTPIGVYEFFDSAGNRYGATVADYGPITPSATSQTVSDTSTLYRQVTVSGDANLVGANISSGTSIFGVAGSVTLPAVGKVLTGTSFGVGGNGSTGTLTLPLASNVVQGSSTYGDPSSPITPVYAISFPALIVRPVAPTISGVSFNFSPDRITLTWGAVTGATGYIVLMNTSQAVSWTPTDGVTYTTGSYGSDSMIYAGSGTSVTYQTPVTAGTTFYFAIYSYQANRVYSYAPTTKTMLSCEGLAGGTWIAVPGDAVYGTSGFCVQKYIPSNVSGVPTSQTGTTPWVSISQTSSRSACSGLGTGYHLITNPEWMTLGANIANTASNWSGGAVGAGTLSRGHSDNNPASACAADGGDANAWVETTCTGQTQGSLAFNQRRTQYLSNGNVIWDFGGNVWQWVDYNNASDKPTPATAAWYEYTAITGSTTTPKSHLVPLNSVQSWWSDSWNSSQGLGMIYPGTNDGTSGALRRGAYWGNGSDAGPFAVYLSNAPSNADGGIGLRCAWQP